MSTNGTAPGTCFPEVKNKMKGQGHVPDPFEKKHYYDFPEGIKQGCDNRAPDKLRISVHARRLV